MATGAQSSAWSTTLERRRVLVCAGPGGVGKTTTAAALAVLGARRGLSVAALTVDPARRLADSLGIGDPGGDPREVPRDLWSAPDQPSQGRLTVMMMDTKRTFDEVVERYASSPEARDRILNNSLYRQVSAHLAGAHEYMAMEKLLSVKSDSQYDLIVLDTPPTRDALDFLSAPERMVGALDSSVLSWLGQALHPTRGLTLGLLARGISRVLSAMGRITGQELLEQLAAFVVDLNDLFGGFRERATAVAQAFRGPEFGFVLVSSTRPAAIEETLRLAAQLAKQKMALDAFIVNRVQTSAGTANAAQITESLRKHAAPGDPAQEARLVEKIAELALAQNLSAAHAAERVRSIQAGLSALALGGAFPILTLPELPADVQGVDALKLIAEVLAAPPAAS
jgi:anion-transporting  ArsA/GET3 family ATPase